MLIINTAMSSYRVFDRHIGADIHDTGFQFDRQVSKIQPRYEFSFWAVARDRENTRLQKNIVIQTCLPLTVSRKETTLQHII